VFLLFFLTLASVKEFFLFPPSSTWDVIDGALFEEAVERSQEDLFLHPADEVTSFKGLGEKAFLFTLSLGVMALGL